MEFFSQLTDADRVLIFGNMFAGAVGATLGSIMITSDLNSNEDLSFITKIFNLAQNMWSFSRLIIGVYYSLIISFFVVGSLTQDVYSVLNVFGFTLFTSVFAPKIWMSQEENILRIIDHRVKALKKDI